jgi:hypothetical protein
MIDTTSFLTRASAIRALRAADDNRLNYGPRRPEKRHSARNAQKQRKELRLHDPIEFAEPQT